MYLFICRRDSVTSPGSQVSYEDKRKENFDRGQAELERRRAALLEVQMKEKVSSKYYFKHYYSYYVELIVKLYNVNCKLNITNNA